MQKENWWGIKDGLKDLRGEVGKWASEWKERLGDDSHIYVVPGRVLMFRKDVITAPCMYMLHMDNFIQ